MSDEIEEPAQGEGREESVGMERIRTVCVYAASSDKASAVYHQAARRLGQELARKRITIIYGGGSTGLMGRLAEGALSEGGRVIGVLPQFMDELEWGHQSLTELRVVADMHERKRFMLETSDAVVALPGASGTLEELFEAITWKRLGLHTKPIVMVNINGFFDPCIEMLLRCVSEQFMHDKHASMWSVVSEPEAVVGALNSAPEWSADARTFAVQR
jgi:uncharacterized protein (TIGR00730 family)